MVRPLLIAAACAALLPTVPPAGADEPQATAVERAFAAALPHLAGAYTASSQAAAATTPTTTSDSRPDPLGDVISAKDGGQTVEPRADISSLSLSYREDRLEVVVTVPGGVDPATSPNWRGNLSGVAAAFDVNGDDSPDFGSVLVADANGALVVATFAAPPTPVPSSIGTEDVCFGAGSYNASTRTYLLSVPAACIGNAYEVRAAAILLFNRATSVSEQLDLTLDVVPAATPLPGVHRDTERNGNGYRFVARDGGIFSFGNAAFLGSTGDLRLNQPIVGMATTATGRGYWLVARDGGIFTFGDAAFLGSTGDLRLNEPIVGMAATHTGKGYWLVARDGGVFTFGDAAFHGSAANGLTPAAVVGMAATATGAGYWIARADGSVSAFGDATRLSAGNGSAAPVVAIAATPSGRGFWLAHADGAIANTGDARYLGDAGFMKLNAPIVGLAASPTGRGYWLLGGDGGVFTYGDAAFHGSTGNLELNQPVISLSV
jgi:hypothetical protein